MNDTENVAVVFVDMSGFTALTEAHGDHTAARLATEFTALTRGLLAAEDRLVKSIGDAVLFTSPNPLDALTALDKIIDATHQTHRYPLLRAGIHFGPVVQTHGDIYGTTVNVAARLAAAAAPGQTLGTRALAAAAETAGIPVIDLGPKILRNMNQPQTIFAIGLDSDCHCGQIDPVCRMRLPPQTAVTKRIDDGVQYRFCSVSCAQRFVSHPPRFAEPTPCPQDTTPELVRNGKHGR